MMKRQGSQKGMTLLEVTVGLAIVGMIGIGVLGLINHELKLTGTARACVTAAEEIKGAARWISQDAMMTESTNLVEGAQPANDLALNWIERYEFINVPHACSYSLCGTELCRDYDGTVTTVARHISGVKFSQAGNLLTVSITCTPPWIGQSRTVEKTYHIYLRTIDGGLGDGE